MRSAKAARRTRAKAKGPSGRPPEWFFHFSLRGRHEQLVILRRIAPYENEQTKPRPGISLSVLDPREETRDRIAMANWGSLTSARKATTFIALPSAAVRRPRRVPKTAEWVTTQGIDLSTGCWSGIWNDAAGRYQADLRPPFRAWR